MRLLLSSQFAIKLGFNLLMPYLAGHLSHGLGMAAWVLGVVLGVRNASQRGLSLVGGYLSDRLGCRTAVIAGCALRTLGFALLGTATGVPGLVLAAAATGFAGALFDPGVRTLLSQAAGEGRVEAFARFNIAGQAGLLLGPLAGLGLSWLPFPGIALVAAAVFAALTVVQAIWLPRANQRRTTRPVQWGLVLRNRAFLCFSLAMVGSAVLAFQVYLALPLVMERALGPEQNVGMGEMFALSAVLVITLQKRVSAWASRRWTPPRAMAAGVAVLGLAFVPMVAFSTPTAPALASEELAEHLATLPMLVTAALLALGTMLILPFEMDMIVRLARGRLVATHYGVYATVSGLGITAGSLVTGIIWDSAGSWGVAWLPWATLVLIGAGSALAVMLLDRLQVLAEPYRKGKHRANTALSRR